MDEECRLIKEQRADDAHKKALAVCELITECKSLKTALALQKLPAIDFYRMRREHRDVQQAWQEAQEILADIKVSSLSELNDKLIDEEGLTVGTFTAVTKNERWLVEKLAPDRYGARPQAQQAFVQNNVQILQQLTDEQIMQLANGSPVVNVTPAVQDTHSVPALPETPALLDVTPQQAEVVQDMQKVLDTPDNISYNSCSSGGSVAASPKALEATPYSVHNNISSPKAATATPRNKQEQPPQPQPHSLPTQPQSHSLPTYDLSAFGDLI